MSNGSIAVTPKLSRDRIKPNIHSEGVPDEIFKTIGWGFMSYHIFQKNSQFVFPTKRKKNPIKSKSQK